MMVIYFGFPASVLIKAERLVRIKQIKKSGEEIAGFFV